MSSGNQPERVWIDQIAPIPVTSADPLHRMAQSADIIVCNGMDAPILFNGIDVPKWKCLSNHLKKNGGIQDEYYNGRNRFSEGCLSSARSRYTGQGRFAQAA
jgi:hypothetical protein